ncbi:twitching motility protein PilT [Vibrio cholerae HC-19A1]|uniref:Uncharacterized protein n=2 Tax=Vibrio cholerae TaxID=666 RepID=A0A0X1L2S7_VIBCO|nr:hypothetical protein VC0395_A0041 [Vibrio cholerae O395]ACQ59296.1 hypothetical protein VCD_001117 [Vibrio cholerae MJ-1236]APF48094.1 hypothetical protein ASZ80_00526 [Vibrio cholerae]EAZ72603.1 hypothetical protein A5C_0526 [Vibrio cholerae NCTC 8457]EAZ77537.1 hypothetical protein A5E_0548 [Vibrio cholerae B33]EET24841.1 conserved hypothetical protein [Vibrio cholerae MO10]EGR04281.1 twitching motility protein PilT [Vibrio cholerae HCUF01]EGR04811.1 twitching motility protein PilT [Vib
MPPTNISAISNPSRQGASSWRDPSNISGIKIKCYRVKISSQYRQFDTD